MMMLLNVRAKIAIILTVAAAAASSSIDPPVAKPGCDDKCGNVTIPYPFGTRPDCYLDSNFSITCDKKTRRAFLTKSNLRVTNISYISGELHILQAEAKCSNQTPYYSFPFNTSAFTFSSSKNKFTVIGCNTMAVIEEGRNITGCSVSCNKVGDSSVQEEACNGNGCCQLNIPTHSNTSAFTMPALDPDDYDYSENASSAKNSCVYAFVIEQDKFRFQKSYINYTFPDHTIPAVLEWSIRNGTCLAGENRTNCTCGPNSIQSYNSDLPDGSGHRCLCLDGFHGNPYLQACQDIDECENETHDCKSKHQCKNTPGNYTCTCPNFSYGDGRNKGNNCTPTFIPIILGIGVGLIVLLVGSSWLYFGYKKWKFIQKKEKFFKKNGGLILEQHLSQWQSPVDSVKIFSQEELEKATNKFDDSTVVGTGGYGTVYRGVLEAGWVVAIKKSKFVDQSQINQFINEVIILSQINHRHVVRLFGCCLETQVPLLVYEFITNGTLFNHIHNNSLSWKVRLKIASETAGVVSYLHSSASTPIIHRDIKSANILLDANFTAKVSDFGASKLVPTDQNQISTLVQGTLGYLDPEYLLTSELTEKSDVYSFGIVLMELITGKKAVCSYGPEAKRNLAIYVLCAMKEDRLVEVVDKRMAIERNLNQIKEVAKLAKECCKIKGEERPSMKEVAMELEGLRLMQVEYSGSTHNNFNREEFVNLLDGDSESSQFVVGDSINAMDNSIKAQALTHISKAR